MPAELRQQLRFARLHSGARIAWATSGKGPALVRAAHWMTHVEHDLHSPIWRPWLERLGREVQLVRYDERGCGLSGPDETPLGLEAALEEIEVVVEALGLAHVALLGMSGAVAPAVAYAARHPDRVTHLVLLGGYTHGMLHRAHSAQQLQLHEATAKLIELGWGQRDAAVQQFFTAKMIPDATPEQVRSLNDQQRLSCDGARAAAIFRARVALDVRELLPLVRCPTLVLHADGDAVVPVELGRELAASIAGARFETLPSRNHIPLAGEPAFERFCAAVGALIHPRHDAVGGPFTPREQELLALVAQGLDNLQIAAHTGLADKTVRNALSKLYATLHVEGRPQAVARARDLGFG
jgi:pimeloyl-ACP methyl ester carboxylesterase/DNA-binding CsgD family transcriptional regulator